MSSKKSKCPFHQAVADKYQPFDLKDPFPFYKEAREQAPIFYKEDLDYYVVTKYDDIKSIFDNWKLYTSQNAQKPVKQISAAAKKVLEDSGMLGLSGLSARIPPDHTRIRNIVTRGFGLARFKTLEPRIRALAIKMIEDFKDNGHQDFIKHFAYNLPAYVIFMLLGVPDEDKDKVKDWAASRLMLTWGDLDEEGQIFHANNLVKYWNYCQNLVAQRHKNQTDDLPGDLVGYQLAGDNITDKEIAAICYSQLFAGHETTTSLMGNGVRELLTHRSSWEQLKENEKLIPKAVNEILRFNPSILSWRRKAMEESIVGGVTIPKGANLLLVMASGNRDEEMFPDGEEFDITRKNARKHLSFGYGIHFCLGAPLAQLEFKIVLQELTKRMPDLRLVPNQDYQFAENTSFRAPTSLFVEWKNK